MRYRLPTRFIAGALGVFLALGSAAGIWMLVSAPGLRFAGFSMAFGGAICAYMFLYAAWKGVDAPFDDEEQE